MKKLLIVLLLALAGCTSKEPPKTSPILCGVLDIAASIGAQQIALVQECEDYAPIKLFALTAFSKVYSCDGKIKALGPVCDMAVDLLLTSMSQGTGYADAVSAAKCKYPMPPKVEELKKAICAKIPL